uniref:Uncharacterized protein n=1 Tax=Physcomitrium patens TaxID=3218 RepID=A0A7I4BXI4_PHYPA
MVVPSKLIGRLSFSLSRGDQKGVNIQYIHCIYHLVSSEKYDGLAIRLKGSRKPIFYAFHTMFEEAERIVLGT